MSPLAIVGYAALAVLVVGWLVVSFSPPGRRRDILEWICAGALYVALLMLFVNLGLHAREADSTVGMIAFGFLIVFFAGGLVVTLVNIVRALGKPRTTRTSAIN